MSTAIAFIGLGNMGAPMAGNLVSAGFSVTGFDLSGEALQAAQDVGVTVADTAAEAVAGASVVMTMLPSAKHVLDAYNGDNGLLDSAPANTLFIDSSTISVDDAREAARIARDAGHRAIDAPVSGGVMGASAGTLTFMVGGSQVDATEADAVLQSMAGRVVHCGDAGAGQAAKVCNNLMLAVSMIGVSEAFVLGEKLGLTNEALYDVASSASGQCWALTTNCPVPGPVPGSPANRDYQPGFAGALMNKDLGLAMDAVESTGMEARIGSLTAALYRKFAENGGASLDFSGIITHIRDHSESETA